MVELGAIIMLFKVFYQESLHEVPVRENTKTLFINGESERDIRKKLTDRKYNIEYINPVTGAYLEYEKQNEDFKVLEI
jgi:DNA-dependent RNA polymerase auxiliary subunit epsilon